MSTQEAITWQESLDIPDQASPADARAFFGVPPDPEGQLDKNINKKRRVWRSKVRSKKASAEAEAKVKAALKLIDFLAEHLKRGDDVTIDLGELNDIFREAPAATLGDLEELWELVERLLADGEIEEALKVGYEARDRYTESVVPHAVFAWVAALASRAMAGADDRLREEGLRSADVAVAEDDAAPDVYFSRAILQLDLGRGPEALTTLEDAERRIDGDLPSNLETLWVEALVATDRVEDAVQRAIDAVELDPSDHAIRSAVAFSLANALQFQLLPIRSAQALERYQRVAEVAAWCAQGAPEAEDTVRPFRMWAVIADNPMYAGDVPRRAFAGVLTGFLILPLLNRLRSKAQWQIIDKGPDSVSFEVFADVASGAVSRAVHGPIKDRLPWWDDFEAELRRYQESQGGSA